MISLNNLGEKVIATNSFYYTLLENKEPLLCCGEYQDTHYCFANNTKQGCAFCEFDESDACLCEGCEG